MAASGVVGTDCLPSTEAATFGTPDDCLGLAATDRGVEERRGWMGRNVCDYALVHPTS